jgi:hypothetical protein
MSKYVSFFVFAFLKKCFYTAIVLFQRVDLCYTLITSATGYNRFIDRNRTACNRLQVVRSGCTVDIRI